MADYVENFRVCLAYYDIYGVPCTDIVETLEEGIKIVSDIPETNICGANHEERIIRWTDIRKIYVHNWCITQRSQIPSSNWCCGDGMLTVKFVTSDESEPVREIQFDTEECLKVMIDHILDKYIELPFDVEYVGIDEWH